jgi:hypothetical protein
MPKSRLSAPLVDTRNCRWPCTLTLVRDRDASAHAAFRAVVPVTGRVRSDATVGQRRSLVGGSLVAQEEVRPCCKGQKTCERCPAQALTVRPLALARQAVSHRILFRHWRSGSSLGSNNRSCTRLRFTREGDGGPATDKQTGAQHEADRKNASESSPHLPRVGGQSVSAYDRPDLPRVARGALHGAVKGWQQLVPRGFRPFPTTRSFATPDSAQPDVSIAEVKIIPLSGSNGASLVSNRGITPIRGFPFLRRGDGRWSA